MGQLQERGKLPKNQIVSSEVMNIRVTLSRLAVRSCVATCSIALPCGSTLQGTDYTLQLKLLVGLAKVGGNGRCGYVVIRHIPPWSGRVCICHRHNKGATPVPGYEAGMHAVALHAL